MKKTRKRVMDKRWKKWISLLLSGAIILLQSTSAFAWEEQDKYTCVEKNVDSIKISQYYGEWQLFVKRKKESKVAQIELDSKKKGKYKRNIVC